MLISRGQAIEEYQSYALIAFRRSTC